MKKNARVPKAAIRPRWRLMNGSAIALGPGKADLLAAIGSARSISGAARDLGMSYRRAWVLVQTMNGCFSRPLVSTSSWRGEGAALTASGREALMLYKDIEKRSLRACRGSISRLTALLAAASSPRKPRRARRNASRTGSKPPSAGSAPRKPRRARRSASRTGSKPPGGRRKRVRMP